MAPMSTPTGAMWVKNNNVVTKHKMFFLIDYLNLSFDGYQFGALESTSEGGIDVWTWPGRKVYEQRDVRIVPFDKTGTSHPVLPDATELHTWHGNDEEYYPEGRAYILFNNYNTGSLWTQAELEIWEKCLSSIGIELKNWKTYGKLQN